MDLIVLECHPSDSVHHTTKMIRMEFIVSTMIDHIDILLGLTVPKITVFLR